MYSPESQKRDMEELLQNRAFLRFTARILTSCRVLAPSFSGSDSAFNAFYEGGRSVGLMILNEAENYRPGGGLALLEEMFQLQKFQKILENREEKSWML